MSDLDIFDDNDFESNEITNNNKKILNNINSKIFIEQKKRRGKSVTYIYNWYENKDDLKEPLKRIKKKLGKGGSIKSEIFDNSNDNESLCIMIQGDRIINDIIEILNKEFNIAKDKIKIIGVK